MNRIQVLLLLGAATLVVAIALSSRTGENTPAAFAQAGMLLLEQLPATLLWLLAALGIGGWAGPLLARSNVKLFDREALVLAVGVVTLLWVDSILGVSGILTLPGVAFFTLAIPGFLGILRMRNWVKPEQAPTHANWALAATTIPLAVLLMASLSTPGWLWETEFGGYDALSYHLQLPREWISAGAIIETPHNAYGYLPNTVEAAFMHLGLLAGGMEEALESTQLLVAAWTLIAAILCARTARRFVPEDARPLAAALAAAFFLATPWVLVVGSLAYTESALILAFSAMLLILVAGNDPDWRMGIVLGVLAAGACLAKPSAIVLVIIPLGVAALILLSRGRWLPLAASACLAALVMVLPWMVRNAAWTGNPVFPFMTTLLGHGNWTTEQVAIWNTAHGAEGGPGTWLTSFFNEFLRQGIGPAPVEQEPWRAQWSILPWAGALGFIFLMLRIEDQRLRRMSASLGLFVVVSIVMWLLFTHAKARFLVPNALPLAIIVACGATMLCNARATRPLPVIAAWLMALLPLGIYLQEGRGMPAWGIARSDAFRGDMELAIMQRAEEDAQLRQLLQSASPAFYLNHLLSEESKILLLGDAAPLHLRSTSRQGPRFAYSTVWTRGPLEALIQEGTEPGEWVDGLAEQGFTHVYIRPDMLERWHRSGWLATELSSENISGFTGSLTPMHRFPTGSALFRIPTR